MKHKDPIWNFYDIKEDGSKKTATCKCCKTVVSAKSERLKTHKLKCSGSLDPGDSLDPVATEPEKLNECTNPGPCTPGKRKMPDDDEETPCSPISTPKRAKLRQRNLSGYSMTTDSATRDKLDEQIAKLFYACNLPFNIADNPVWRETVELLRPGYASPSRKDIGGHLLDKVHEKVSGHMKTMIQGKEAVLVQDGWSDIYNSPVIASSLHVDNKSYFLSAVETRTNKKTAQYCTEVALETIKEATEHYDCHVTGVVTDNEKKMEVMKRNLKENDPELTVYGCSSHWLNLLGQDVTPSQVVSQIVEVNKYFRNHHVPAALLGNMTGSVKPQIPGDTRWNSQLHCVEKYVRNRPFMLMIAAQNEDSIEQRIKSLIHNVGLANEAKHLEKQLGPLSAALNKLQSDSSSIADACEVWISLTENEELAPHIKKVEKRFDQAMTASHFLANILHPKYRGKNLKAEHISSAQDLLQEQKPELVPSLLEFMCEDTRLPKATQETNVTRSPRIKDLPLKNALNTISFI